MRFRSHYPPFSYQGITGEWYVICSSDGDGWVKVNRRYSWDELEKVWDKIIYGGAVKVKPAKKERKEFKVKGSKGNVYKVVSEGDWWTCTCPAHGFGRGKDCKHIKQIKHEK